MTNLISIGIGGILGATLRYYLSLFIQKNIPSLFPYGTLIVNVSGCFLIGFIMQFLSVRPWLSTSVRLLLVTGFLGSYTTFSTFGYETCQLLLNGNYKLSFLNILFNNIIGLIAVILGMTFANLF